MLDTERLHRQIAASCPITGVFIGDPADKKTWRVDFAPEATDADKASAAGIVAAFVSGQQPAKPTPEEKLAATGLTVEDLKSLVGVD